MKSSFYIRMAILIALTVAWLSSSSILLAPGGEKTAGQFLYPLITTGSKTEAAGNTVALLEFSNEDVEKYGWPFPYELYEKIFKSFEGSNKPIILQTFHFSQKNEHLDKLATVIKEHGKIVGSNFNVQSKEGLAESYIPEKIEEYLFPQIFYSNKSTVDSELPLLPLSFHGIPEIANSYAHNGYTANYSRNLPNNCTELYLASQSHDLVIPSSVFSAIDLHSEGKVSTSRKAVRSGISSFAQNESTNKLPSTICWGQPLLSTQKYLSQRNIITYDLNDLFTGQLKNKKIDILVLGASWENKIRDAGVNIFSRNSFTKPSHLNVRSLDELANKSYLNFSPIPVSVQMIILCAAYIISILLILTGNVKGIIFIGVLTLLSSFGYVQLQAQIHQNISIPTHLIFASISAVFIGVLGLLGSIFWQMYTLTKLKNRITGLLEVTWETANISKIMADHVTSKMKGSRFILDMANSLPKEANAANVERKRQNVEDRENRDATTLLPVEGGLEQSKLVLLEIDGKPKETVGKICFKHTKRSAPKSTFEKSFFNQLLETTADKIIQIELRSRKAQAERMKKIAEQNSQVLEHFLPNRLLTQVVKEDLTNIDEVLSNILKPRKNKVALLQADIRGFSKLSKIYEPLEMVYYIQSYYKDVVDRAQEYAQIKLIGDCIFLFIEEEVKTDTKNAVDIAYDIATHLVDNTQQTNEIHKGKENVNFGIAIHYGEAVTGNLSSSNCIDYTVLGNEVNRVARMEELTKNKTIASIVKNNGIIMSPSAFRQLSDGDIKQDFSEIPLSKLGIQVRSFSDMTHIFYKNMKISPLTAREPGFEKVS